MPRAARLALLAIILTAALLAAVAVFVVARFIASAAGDPVIIIDNATGRPLTRITCTLTANGASWTEHVPTLEPGAHATFSRPTADLFIMAAGFELDGRQHEWKEGGIATPGERLRIRINSQGAVAVSYDR